MVLLLIRKINLPRRFIILFTAYCLLLTVYCLLLPLPAEAALQWSLSVVDGYYLPTLENLNYVLRYKEVELGPRNTEGKPYPYPVIYQGVSPDRMPEMSPMAPKVGLQLQVDVNPRYALVFGNSIAAFDSSKRDIRQFFVGFYIPSDRVTRFSLSLNQLWFGIKRYWIFEEDAGKKKQTTGEGSKEAQTYQPPVSRIYAEMGILAVTRAFLTTDAWMHVYAPEEGFDFYKVTETGSAGNGYASYLGIGGEYYLKKWLSVGMDVDYVIGGVSNMKFNYYFTVDPLEKDIIKQGDKVVYSDFKKGYIKPLFLDLGGFDLKGQIRFYFE